MDTGSVRRVAFVDSLELTTGMSAPGGRGFRLPPSLLDPQRLERCLPRPKCWTDAEWMNEQSNERMDGRVARIPPRQTRKSTLYPLLAQATWMQGAWSAGILRLAGLGSHDMRWLAGLLWRLLSHQEKPTNAEISLYCITLLYYYFKGHVWCRKDHVELWPSVLSFSPVLSYLPCCPSTELGPGVRQKVF